MKAIVCRKYGPPSSLKIEELPDPEPKSDEVRVVIKACAINDFDWSLVRGIPHVYRLLFGIFKPKRNIPGMEISGVIDAVGDKVEGFEAGDAVYGDTSEHTWGGLAEKMCIRASEVRIKPHEMSFVDAAATPHASMLAFQGLVSKGMIKNGDKVLINGAGGGVGNFAIQICNQFDVHVTGVDNGEKQEIMSSWGYDEVINYKETDFTKTGEKYDLIVDARSTRNPSDYARALNEKGRFISVGGDVPKLLRIHFSRKKWKRKGKMVIVLGMKPNKNLDQIEEWYSLKGMRPFIDGPYPFEEAPAAIERFGEAKHFGKIVVKL